MTDETDLTPDTPDTPDTPVGMIAVGEATSFFRVTYPSGVSEICSHESTDMDSFINSKFGFSADEVEAHGTTIAPASREDFLGQGNGQ